MRGSEDGGCMIGGEDKVHWKREDIINVDCYLWNLFSLLSRGRYFYLILNNLFF